jgi:hypothetical protein
MMDDLDALKERLLISAAASAGVGLLFCGVDVSEWMDLSESCVLLPERKSPRVNLNKRRSGDRQEKCKHP